MDKKISNGKSVIFRSDFLDYSSGELLSPIKTQNYYLLQSADSYYLTDFSIGEHTQFCDFEITYVIFGSLTCITDGVKDKVEKGEVYLSFAGEKHTVESKNNARFQTLAINIVENSPTKKILLELKEKFSNPSLRKLKINLSEQMTAILSEFIDGDMPFKEVSLDALITEILVRLHRNELKTANKFYNSEDLLPDLLNYLDKNYLNISTLAQLSDEFGYSYGYLCKVFKKINGVTLNDYLAQKRMTYAKQALIDGKPVTEVSEVLGYNSPFNFTRAFKNFYGIAPTKIKK